MTQKIFFREIQNGSKMTNIKKLINSSKPEPASIYLSSLAALIYTFDLRN